MNTNNVYIAKIYVVKDIEKKRTIPLGLCTTYSYSFLRKTLVYRRKNGKFYDLLENRFIAADFNYFVTEIGDEILRTNTLIPFNHIINNNKDRVSKRKVKELYMDYNNLDNNK